MSSFAESFFEALSEMDGPQDGSLYKAASFKALKDKAVVVGSRIRDAAVSAKRRIHKWTAEPGHVDRKASVLKGPYGAAYPGRTVSTDASSPNSAGSWHQKLRTSIGNLSTNKKMLLGGGAAIGAAGLGYAGYRALRNDKNEDAQPPAYPHY